MTRISLMRPRVPRMRGERSIIQTTIGGKKMAFLFDNFTLREVEITAGNSFEHELQR